MYIFEIWNNVSYEYINEISCYTETYVSLSMHNYEQVGGVAWKGSERPHSAVKDKTHESNGISNQTCAEEVLYICYISSFQLRGFRELHNCSKRCRRCIL